MCPLIRDSVDLTVQQPMFPEFAFNNTYGIQAITEGTYRGLKNRYNLDTGCGTALPPCIKLAAETDPDNLGPAAGAGNVCNHAGFTCLAVYSGYAMFSGVSPPPLVSCNGLRANMRTEEYIGCDSKKSKSLP